jgi:hypothetical protein
MDMDDEIGIQEGDRVVVLVKDFLDFPHRKMVCFYFIKTKRIIKGNLEFVYAYFEEAYGYSKVSFLPFSQNYIGTMRA